MATFPFRNPATIALALGAVMGGVFVTLVLRYDHDLRGEIRQKMIERDAAVLTGVAQQEIETGAGDPGGTDPERWLAALLPAAHREGLLAMTIFDADGVVLEKIPANQPQVELPPEDFVPLHSGRPITRYWPAFSLATLLIGGPASATPVLEIVLPLRGRKADRPDRDEGPIGFVRYHLDARLLAVELGNLDASVRRQTVVTLAVGLTSLGLLVGAAYVMLQRAQRIIAERTARLQRTNFELTLAAKASALGQITSHLVHGLQGSVAGLRSVVSTPAGDSDWKTAAGYAEQMQAMIEEIVGLLDDQAKATAFEMTGPELADVIRRRNLRAASDKRVDLAVDAAFSGAIDNHRGGLLCLIASNLVQNAIAAVAPGGEVTVTLRREPARFTLRVRDNGLGIPAEIRDHLFEPGHTSRAGGTGLGLAISQLLARQIGATLVLESTGPTGTTFRLDVPAIGQPGCAPA